MALLAEELVEEWLNRQGFFTIRGIKIGVNEVDLVAIRLLDGGSECRHIEVQASVRPVSYISKLPKSSLTLGQQRTSAIKRNDDLLRLCVKDWVKGKFYNQKKVDLFKDLFGVDSWSRELVVNKVKDERELEHIQDEGVIVHQLMDVVEELNRKDFLIKSSSGADFVDLVLLGK